MQAILFLVSRFRFICLSHEPLNYIVWTTYLIFILFFHLFGTNPIILKLFLLLNLLVLELLIVIWLLSLPNHIDSVYFKGVTGCWLINISLSELPWATEQRRSLARLLAECDQPFRTISNLSSSLTINRRFREVFAISFRVQFKVCIFSYL